MTSPAAEGPADTTPTAIADPDPEQRSEQSWVEYEEARKAVAAVMTDDELRALGVNVDILDVRP